MFRCGFPQPETLFPFHLANHLAFRSQLQGHVPKEALPEISSK